MRHIPLERTLSKRVPVYVRMGDTDPPVGRYRQAMPVKAPVSHSETRTGWVWVIA